MSGIDDLRAPYSRTGKPYELDEIVFIVKYLEQNGVHPDSVKDVALIVKRSPEAIKYKFLTYRDKLPDGSYGIKTVKPFQAIE